MDTAGFSERTDWRQYEAGHRVTLANALVFAASVSVVMSPTPDHVNTHYDACGTLATLPDHYVTLGRHPA